MLTAIGWINGDGSPLTGAEAAATTSGTHAVLRRLGVLPAGPDGVAFARAALSTWPGGRLSLCCFRPPQLAQQPGGRLGLAVAGEHSLVVAAGPVHRLSGGEVGEVPHVLPDDLRDAPEDP